MKTRITAFASSLPSSSLTNEKVGEMFGVDNEFILQRTGVRSRRYTHPQEQVSDMCYKAACNLRDELGIDLSDVDFILVASISGDQLIPSISSQLQHRLKIKKSGAVDILAACAGFTYAMVIAKGLISTGFYKKILVFGADALSKVTDYTDLGSVMLFGDGAGVALLEASSRDYIGEIVCGAFGAGGSDLYMTSYLRPILGQKVVPDSKIHQNGKVVFKWAVSHVSNYVRELLQRENLSPDDIDWFVPHNANLRIMEGICEKCGISKEKLLISIEEFGNTSSASIPLAIDLARKSGKLKGGDKILIIGYGGGLVYAGLIFEWHDPHH